MKANPNWHLAVNLFVVLLLIAIVVGIEWALMPFSIGNKIVVAVFSAVLILYIGHRLIPRMTNRIVETLFGKD